MSCVFAVVRDGRLWRRPGDSSVEHKVKVGDFWQTPGGVSHGFRGGPEGALILDIFSPPREEYKNTGSGFGN